MVTPGLKRILLAGLLWTCVNAYAEPASLNTLFQDGLQALEHRNIPVAVTQLTAASKLAKDSNDPRYGKILSALGTVRLRQARYTEALEHFEKALPLLQNTLGDDHPDVAMVLEQIGMVHHVFYRNDKASRFYAAALAHYSKAFPAESPRIQSIRNKQHLLQLGGTLVADDIFDLDSYQEGMQAFSLGHYRETIDALNRVLTIPIEHPALDAVHELLGKATFNVQEFAAAQLHFEQAIARREVLVGANHESLIPLLIYLGDAYQSEEKIDEARAAYEKALSLVDSTTGHPSLAQIQDKLATLHTLATQSATYLSDLETDVKRWNDQNGDIAVYFTPGDSTDPNWNPDYPAQVQEAFKHWVAALNNRIQVVYTPDPTEADVVVSWSRTPIQMLGKQAVLGQNHYQTWSNLISLSNLNLSTYDQYGKPLPAERLYLIALHEIGHLFGIKGHSRYPMDVMYATAYRPTLSTRDIATIRALYDKPPTYSNPVGIRLARFQTILEWVQQGKAAFDERNHTRAYELFSKARQAYSLNSDINYYTGLSAYLSRHFDNAIQIGQALLLQPNDPHRYDAHSFLGYTYAELAKQERTPEVRTRYMDSAIHHLQEALQKPNLSGTEKDQLESTLGSLRQGQFQSRAGFDAFQGWRW